MTIFPIDPHSPYPLGEQVVQGVIRLIENGAIRPGSRLPSIRQFAQHHGISRFTVVNAYDRLVAEGYLQSRRGAGFYVMPCRKVPQGESCDQTVVHLERAVDVLWLLRRATGDADGRAMPGCGWLPANWQDQASLERALRAQARQGARELVDGYGSGAGYPPLRRLIAQRLGELGIVAHGNQILTTTGASHALDLVARYLLRPAETVLVDDPGYFNLFGHLRFMGARLIGVPWTHDGPDLRVLEALLREHRPRLYFTNTVLHNPTAVSLSQACAHRLLRLAEEYDLLLVEDDVYGDLHPGGVPRLAALDQLQRVIYINGFSKTVSAKLRVGYLAARADLVDSLLDVKLLTAVTCPEVSERLVFRMLSEGHYRKHVARLRHRLQEAQETTLRALERCGLLLHSETPHGMFAWCRLPEEIDSGALAAEAYRDGLMLAPGRIFSPDPCPSPWLRFNVAHCCQHPTLYSMLSRAIEQHFNLPNI